MRRKKLFGVFVFSVPKYVYKFLITKRRHENNLGIFLRCDESFFFYFWCWGCKEGRADFSSRIQGIWNIVAHPKYQKLLKND